MSWNYVYGIMEYIIVYKWKYIVLRLVIETILEAKYILKRVVMYGNAFL